MTQFDFGTIDPTVTSGTELASILDDWRDALESMHSGTSRPSYAQAGLMWINTASTPWIVNLYDGTNDILIGYFDATAHQYYPLIGGGTGNIASGSTCDVGSKPYGLLTITGSTTITSFGSSMLPGTAKFCVVGTSGFTIQQGTSILTSTGQNILAQPGDAFHLWCLSSGNYMIVGYTPVGSPQRTAIADAAYSMKFTDQSINYSSITATRIVSLIPAASFPPGRILRVGDESGSLTSAIMLSIAAAGSDKINNQSTVNLTVAYQFLALESNGSNAWTIIAVSNAPITLAQVPAQYGLNVLQNIALSVTNTGGNLLQLQLLTAAGGNPSPASPVNINFQSLTSGNPNGGVSSLAIIASLSMTTFATGATFGVANNTPFRIWLAVFNNAGTPELAMGVFSGLFSGEVQIFPCNDDDVASTVGVSGVATSPGVWYTPNGVSLTNCAYRLLGFADFDSGLATAGTFNVAPSRVVLFGPGGRKCGDVIRRIFGAVTSLSIAPKHYVNLIKVSSSGSWEAQTTANQPIYLKRGSTIIQETQGYFPTGTSTLPFAFSDCLDTPGSISSTVYSVIPNTGTTIESYIELEEIMG